MKTLLFLIVISFVFCFVSCNKTPPAPEPPVENKDSLVNAAKWKAFQLPSDNITLQMKYQETTNIINGIDTLKITLADVYDWVSEESSATIWGANAKVYLKFQLNSNPFYNPTNPLQIERYSEANGNLTIKDIQCGYPLDSLNKSDIIYFKSSPTLSFYNSIIYFRKLSPFLKTDLELKSFLKKDYVTTLYVKKRCR
jgi:hypothetical protein